MPVYATTWLSAQLAHMNGGRGVVPRVRSRTPKRIDVADVAPVTLPACAGSRLLADSQRVHRSVRVAHTKVWALLGWRNW